MLWSPCGCSQGKWCDWTGMIHTGGEQIQGNETRNFRDGGGGGGGARIGERGWASWTAQALFTWTRTHDEPRSGKCGCIAARLLRAVLTCSIRAPRACAVLDCWWHGIAWQRSPVRCLLPCIRTLREKENFQLFHFVQPLKMVHFISDQSKEVSQNKEQLQKWHRCTQNAIRSTRSDWRSLTSIICRRSKLLNLALSFLDRFQRETPALLERLHYWKMRGHQYFTSAGKLPSDGAVYKEDIHA